MECACIHDCEHIEFILCVAQTSRTWSMASAILWKKSHIVIKSMKRISYCFNKFEWCSHTNNETANTIPTVAFSIFSFSIDNWRTLACERAWVVFADRKSISWIYCILRCWQGCSSMLFFSYNHTDRAKWSGQTSEIWNLWNFCFKNMCLHRLNAQNLQITLRVSRVPISRLIFTSIV